MAIDPRTAGQLRERVHFQQRQLDANGDRLGPWLTLWTCFARIQALRGTETVMAARLQGKQPTVITIRLCAAALAIDNSWRAIDASPFAGGAIRVWDITSKAIDERRKFIDVLAVENVGQPNAA